MIVLLFREEMKTETHFGARLEDGRRFTQTSRCAWAAPPPPLGATVLGTTERGGRLTMESGDSQITRWPPARHHLRWALPDPRNGWHWRDTRVCAGSHLWGLCSGAASPEPLWGPSLTSPEGCAWATKWEAKPRSFQEGLHVWGFCFLLPPASSWLKLVNLTCSCHSNSSVVGFALGESITGATHSHCVEEKGEVNPVLQQPSATVPTFAFILPQWTPGSWSKKIFSQILPQGWRKGHGLLAPHLWLKDLGPCLLSRAPRSGYQTLGFIYPTEFRHPLDSWQFWAHCNPFQDHCSHGVRGGDMFSAWAQRWSGLLLGVSCPLPPPPPRSMPVPWTSGPRCPHSPHLEPEPPSFLSGISSSLGLLVLFL